MVVGGTLVVGGAVTAGSVVSAAPAMLVAEPVASVAGGAVMAGSPGTVAPAGILMVAPAPGKPWAMPFASRVHLLSVIKSLKFTLNFFAMVLG